MILFDIETKPRLDLVDRYTKPFPAFDIAGVKYGNTKDPVKRAEILDQKLKDYASEHEAYLANAKDRAALNPLTAEVVAIGIQDTAEPNRVGILSGDNERNTLHQFWTLFSDRALAVESFVFWSGSGNPTENFDVDMLVKRSWALGVPVSPLLFRGPYYSDRVVDAARRYLLGKRDAYCSLTRAADELDLYGPNSQIFPKRDDDPVTGATFWKFWEGDDKQHTLARLYLSNDVRTLAAISSRIL